MVENYLEGDEYLIQSMCIKPKIRVLGVALPKVGEVTYHLTNKRVIKLGRTAKSAQIKDIPLEEIITINYNKNTEFIWLINGIIVLILGLPFVFSGEEWGVLISVVGLGLVIGNLDKRTGKFIIQSANPEASIEIPVRGKSPEVREFIEKAREIQN